MTPATDIMSWVESLPTIDPADRPDTTTPVLPDVPGWSLYLWRSKTHTNLWKITGRRGSVAVNIDGLTAAQVNTIQLTNQGAMK